MKVRVFIFSLCIFLVGCTEENFKKGGRDLLGGLCSKSSNCTVNCDEGKTADRFGRCVYGGGN